MNLPLQLTLRPALPNVYGSKDYRKQRAIIERMDAILCESGQDLGWVLFWMQQREISSDRKAAWLLTGFRCAIARILTGMSLRDFSFSLSDSPILQWFCRCGDYGLVPPPSKSTLLRLDKIIDLQDLGNIIDAITHGAMEPEAFKRLGQPNEPVKLGDVYADCAGVKAPVHFPVDWVLLVDVARTLMQSVLLIRRHGLKHRMPPPESFIKAINKQAMAMSATHRPPDGKKKQKRTLRRMKKICRLVESHAQRYRHLLDENWEETDWTRKQAEQRDGLLVDWQLYEHSVPDDSALVKESVERMELSIGKPGGFITDRGFMSKRKTFERILDLCKKRSLLSIPWKHATGTRSSCQRGCAHRIRYR